MLLNVNVPFLPEHKIRGLYLTRQGLRVYHSRLDERSDPRGQPYYWIGGDAPTGIPEHGTDVGALAEGFTPVPQSLVLLPGFCDFWHKKEEICKLMFKQFLDYPLIVHSLARRV